MTPRGITVALTVFAGLVVASAALWLLTGRGTAADAPATDPESGIPLAAVPDGELFAFVSLASTPDDDHVVVRFDPADLLSGPTAHVAAVDAGVITDDEELPNDIFIVNPDPSTQTLAVDDDAVVTIEVAPAGEPLRSIEIPPSDMYEAFAGAVDEGAVYGVIPGQPVPMTLTIQRGAVVAAAQVLLP